VVNKTCALAMRNWLRYEWKDCPVVLLKKLMKWELLMAQRRAAYSTWTGKWPCFSSGCSPLSRSDVLRASCCLLTRSATLGQFLARDYNNLPVR
jgi:hypothetical protein